MIRSIYIYHEGKCLVTSSYTETPPCDADLFPGFISAISIFAKNILQEEIQKIILKHTTLYHQSKNGLMIVITAFNSVSPKIFKKIFQRLFMTFTIEYGEYLQLKVLNTAFFRPFRVTIDKILRDLLISNPLPMKYHR